ncbi:MAG: helix-hairpin-helix domain-containing protein [Corynebacterium pollutisoli]|uniref:Helix-hairpin-helix domain-containing protein n=1 Tax=Corynebacterium pollutisoli TaxID=1610489 RepID=A0A7X8MY33_9CORY|nr:helix-hairpin-helix domain-containing protein [Corynebacterium pollutisoli]
MSTSFEQIPGVARPARDALTAAGYRDLESLDGVDWEAASGLHGVGKRGLERLQAALLERGLSMRNAPAPEERSAEWTRGNTGTGAPDLVTARTEESPAGYVEKLEGRRREHGRLLLEIFGRATGERPAMWGPSMIGYGQAHYRYATGREGDTFHVGFSPGKARISLYGLQGLPRSEELLARLGKHRTAVSCVYVNKPEDIDLGVLEELVRHAWETDPGGCA